MPEMRAARQHVEHAAAQQAAQLVGVQLKALAEVKNRDAIDARHSAFRREWNYYGIIGGRCTRRRPGRHH